MPTYTYHKGRINQRRQLTLGCVLGSDRGIWGRI